MQSMELHLEGESLELRLLYSPIFFDDLHVYAYKDGKPYWNLGPIKDGIRMVKELKRDDGPYIVTQVG